ncbi:MAG TPA: long-chain fatty acid--CoA ligase [Alphaproteobacteria bacterium]|nr:long-chain fatty acid--CoA ligase [Alphaproteobacteria bacterium]
MIAAVETTAKQPLWVEHYPPGLSWDTDIPVKPIYALLDDAARQFGDRPGFDFMSKKWTYSELARLADRLAVGLKPLISPGTRVGLLLPNCPYYLLAYFAIAKCGGISVNFNPLYTEREISHQILDSGAEVMITIDVAQVADKLVAVADECRLKAVIVCPMAGILPFPKNLLYPLARRRDIAKIPADPRFLHYDRLIRNDGKIVPHPVNPEEDVALLQYTGGTTGTPKGAMLTHANVYGNAVQLGKYSMVLRPGEDKMLAVIPFFHVFAMTVAMNNSILYGIEIIALPRFDVKEVLETIHKKRPTLFPAVPTIYTAISNHPELAKYDISSIRFCMSGGAPLPVEVKQRFEKLTGCTLVEGYGLSETSPVVSANPVVGANKAGSIGIPLPRTMVEIISLDDRITPVPLGQPGELCVSGPQVMKGYWNKPEETDFAMFGGRFHSGDIATMDEDGYIFIVDRLKDIVIASGYKIYPRKVEEEIYLHPAVEECVAGGVADPYRGETLKVWIKLRPGASLTADELREFLKDKLSPIEMPKLVEFRDKPLPKTLIGKLSRKALIDEEIAKNAKAAAAAG